MASVNVDIVHCLAFWVEPNTIWLLHLSHPIAFQIYANQSAAVAFWEKMASATFSCYVIIIGLPCPKICIMMTHNVGLSFATRPPLTFSNAWHLRLTQILHWDVQSVSIKAFHVWYQDRMCPINKGNVRLVSLQTNHVSFIQWCVSHHWSTFPNHAFIVRMRTRPALLENLKTDVIDV